MANAAYTLSLIIAVNELSPLDPCNFFAILAGVLCAVVPVGVSGFGVREFLLTSINDVLAFDILMLLAFPIAFAIKVVVAGNGTLLGSALRDK